MVDVNEIKNLIPQALHTRLVNDTQAWDTIRGQVLIYIAEVTGVDTSPSTRPAELDWIVLPFAWLTEYFANNIISGTSPEYEQRAAKKLDSANKFLQEHRATKPRSGSRALLGTIDNLYE